MDKEIVRLIMNMFMQLLSSLCFISLSQFKNNQKSLNHSVGSLNQVLSGVMQLYKMICPQPLIGDQFVKIFSDLATVMRACENYKILNNDQPGFSGNCTNCSNYESVNKDGAILIDLLNCKKYKCNSLKFVPVGSLETDSTV